MGKRIIGLTLLWLILVNASVWGGTDENVYVGLGPVNIPDAGNTDTGFKFPNAPLKITNSYLTVEKGSNTELTTLTIEATGMNSGLLLEQGNLLFSSGTLTGSTNYTAMLIASQYNYPDPAIENHYLTIPSNITFSGNLNLGLNSYLGIEGMSSVSAEQLNLSGAYASAEVYGSLNVESFKLTGAGSSMNITGPGGFLYAADEEEESIVSGGSLTIGGSGAILKGGLSIDGSSSVVSIVNPSAMFDQVVTVGTGKAITLNNGRLSITGGVKVTDWGSTQVPPLEDAGSIAIRGGFFNVSNGDLWVDKLSISGGVTTIGSDSHVTAVKSLLFGNGIIDLYGTLEATTANQPTFTGLLGMHDATLSLANSVRFAGGGITLYGKDNALYKTIYVPAPVEVPPVDKPPTPVPQDFGTLTIGNNSYLDARQGSLDIMGNLEIEDFVIGRGDGEFNYAAGYDWNTKTVNGVTLTGTLWVDSDARVILSNDLLNYVASYPDDPVRIITADGGVIDAGSFKSTTNTNLYHYDIYLDDDGMYAGNFDYFSDEQIAKNLIRSWNPFTKPKNQATNIIKPDFIHALVDASKVRLNPVYYSLSRDGQFNADTLLNLSNPEGSGLRYDALMYYNGANAANVSNATIALSGHIQSYLEERMNAMRRMKVLVGQYNTPCGDECLGSECSVPYCPGDGELVVGPPTNRIWAGLFNIRDNIDSYNGYAGYSLHGKGFMIGAEHDFGPLLSVGGTFAYTGGDFDDHAALADTSRMELYQFTAYGTYTDPSGIFISGTLGYAWSDNQINSQRYLFPNADGNSGWVGGDYRSGIFNASLQIGYDLFAGDYWTISPSLGVTHRTSWSNSHDEYFTSAEASWNTLDVGRIRNSLTSMPLKVNVAYDAYEDEKSLLTFTGMLGYSYDLQPLEASGDINYVGLQGRVGPVEALAMPQRSRHAYHLGVGTKYNYNSWEFGLGYDAEFRKGWKNYTISGNVGVTF